jgi:hypothetical protein
VQANEDHGGVAKFLGNLHSRVIKLKLQGASLAKKLFEGSEGVWLSLLSLVLDLGD